MSKNRETGTFATFKVRSRITSNTARVCSTTILRTFKACFSIALQVYNGFNILLFIRCVGYESDNKRGDGSSDDQTSNLHE